MLTDVEAKAEVLNVTCTDLVFDQAIFTKALEVMLNPNNFELRDFINLRMGGFHVSCMFLAVIRKWFGSAGLRDLIVEAGFT